MGSKKGNALQLISDAIEAIDDYMYALALADVAGNSRSLNVVDSRSDCDAALKKAAEHAGLVAAARRDMEHAVELLSPTRDYNTARQACLRAHVRQKLAL